MIDDDLKRRFLALFEGGKKTHGRYPVSGRPQTVHKTATTHEVALHLEGKVGLGMVPLRDNATTSWGCIDIDNHGQEEDLDLYGMEEKVKSSSMPLFSCRSKSGGIHLFLFLSEPLAAKNVRHCLKQCAVLFGVPDAEIFPKQDAIKNEEFGNWLNLPYFNAEDTNRYCVRDGLRLSLAEFLDATDREAVKPSELIELIGEVYDGAPPCICRILEKGAPFGSRNTAIFNVAVFYKQANPKSWREDVIDFNAKTISPPLEHREVKQIISSVARRDYFYKCGEEPCRSHCDRRVCKTRTYGLTAEQQQQSGGAEMIEFKGLIKINTEPVQWDLVTALGPVRLNTEQLMSASKTQMAIAEKFLKVIPAMKQDQWHAVVNSLMEKAEIVHAPDDSMPSGLVYLALMDYLSIVPAEEISVVERERRWQAGMPVFISGRIWFSGSKFIEWLRRTRRSEVREPAQVYTMLRDRGILDGRVRIAGNVCRGWYVSKDDMQQKTIPDLPMEEEF